MFKAAIIELIIRGIPEIAIIVWVCFVLAKMRIKLKKYLISTLILVGSSYVVMNLPINKGLNTLLTVGALILINVKINEMTVIKSIQVGFLSYILEFICELIDIIMIKYLFKADITKVFSNVYSKTLYGIPSLLLLVLFTIIISVLMKRQSKQ